MANSISSRWFTLIQRELQEYRVSLLWTPLCIALLLSGVMLLSVLLAGRISAVGEAVLEVVLQDESISGMNISIQIDDDAPADSEINYRIEEDVEPLPEAAWNFSREWRFDPPDDNDGDRDSDRVAIEPSGSGGDSFNPLLQIISALLMLALVLVTVNYLLGSLFDDRKDRSILFWKSMPVSEWEVLGSKLVVALVVAPLVFLAASVIAQVACTLLAMLLVWRMDMDPFQQILGNVEFVSLWLSQIGGWLLVALWVAPLYLWLLLASAAARRSPFWLAVVPPVLAMVLEQALFGTEYLRTAIGSHMPFSTPGISLPVDEFAGASPGVSSLWNLAAGLAVAALLALATVWLRRHRWEI